MKRLLGVVLIIALLLPVFALTGCKSKTLYPNNFENVVIKRKWQATQVSLSYVGKPNDTTKYSGVATTDSKLIALTVSTLAKTKSGYVKVPKEELPSKSKHMYVALYYKWGYIVKVYICPEGYVYANITSNETEVYKSIDTVSYSTLLGIYGLLQS